MTILFHGTTFHRARLIVKTGPNPDYREGGAKSYGPGDFSACLALGPFESAGCPEWYAWTKADKFEGEGGPALLILDVPDELVDLTAVDGYTDPKYGLVQFDADTGIDELRERWHAVRKRILRLGVRPPDRIPTY